MFAESPYPTKTESEGQFALSFVEFLGNIKLFLMIVCAAVTVYHLAGIGQHHGDVGARAH